MFTRKKINSSIQILLLIIVFLNYPLKAREIDLSGNWIFRYAGRLSKVKVEQHKNKSL